MSYDVFCAKNVTTVRSYSLLTSLLAPVIPSVMVNG